MGAWVVIAPLADKMETGDNIQTTAGEDDKQWSEICGDHAGADRGVESRGRTAPGSGESPIQGRRTGGYSPHGNSEPMSIKISWD